MGCAVNGPGEAGDADFGIAGGRDAGFIYAHGEVLRKVPQSALVEELFGEVDAWIAGGMVRPAAQDPQAVAAGRLGGWSPGLVLVAPASEPQMLGQVRVDLGHPVLDPVTDEAVVDLDL